MSVKKVVSGFRGAAIKGGRYDRPVERHRQRGAVVPGQNRSMFDRGQAENRLIIGSVRRSASIWSATSATPIESGLLHPLLPDTVTYLHDVSVIFGTYNRLGHLQACVASVRKACQGLRYEIVVSDGGSTDGSREWMGAQSDVRCLPGDLGGAVKAFNDCFRAASGRVIFTFNDDAEVEPDAVAVGLRHFQNPRVGQVAFAFSVGNRAFEVQNVHGVPYVNYGLVRANVARVVEKICGGLWAPVYYTYGGDTELSCWVHRLGYKVVAEHAAKVVDRQAKDDLRRRSADIEKGSSGDIFRRRWPNLSVLGFRGPMPGISADEQARLRRIEVGESPNERWERLASVDPEPGKLPPRAMPTPERVLHVYLRTDEDPQSSQAQALSSIAGPGHVIVDWLKIPAGERDQAVREAAAKLSPTLVFAQIQGPHLSADVMRAIRAGPHDPSLVTVMWSGDVGEVNGPWAGFSDAWSHTMASVVDAMLYTGTGQVKMQRERGMKNAAYLQIGFDTARYYPGEQDRSGIVFLGQNYGPQWNVIPQNDAQLRRDVVTAFSKHFREFTAYGGGWPNARALHQTKAGDVYRSALMAISVSLTSQLGRYTSDRMIRSMACGTPTLVKRFEDMEGMGLRHGENVLVWDNVEQALAIARDWLLPERRADLLALGRAGAALMHRDHTWHVRMHELAAIVRALRGQR